MSLDTFAADQMIAAMKQGFAETPRHTELENTPERDSVIDVIARVLAQQYTLHPDKPILHWKSIYFRVDEIIKKEISLGLWKHKRPDIEYVRRCVNYSAKKEYFEKYHQGELPKSFGASEKGGFYCLNPNFFDGETRDKLMQIIKDFKS